MALGFFLGRRWRRVEADGGYVAQDTVAKVLDVLTVQNKDVRKGTWSNKEVSWGRVRVCRWGGGADS